MHIACKLYTAETRKWIYCGKCLFPVTYYFITSRYDYRAGKKRLRFCCPQLHSDIGKVWSWITCCLFRNRPLFFVTLYLPLTPSLFKRKANEMWTIHVLTYILPRWSRKFSPVKIFALNSPKISLLIWQCNSGYSVTR